MLEWNGKNGDSDFYMADFEDNVILSIYSLYRPNDNNKKGFFEPAEQWTESNQGWQATSFLSNYVGVATEPDTNGEMEFRMKKSLKPNQTYVIYFLPFSGGYRFPSYMAHSIFPSEIGFPYPYQARVKIIREFNNGVTTKSEEEEYLKSTSDTYGYLNKSYPSYAIGARDPSTITSSTQVKGNGLIFGPIPTTTITLYYKPFIKINGNRYFPMICTNGSDDTDNKIEWKFASCFINNGNATVPQWKRGY